MNRHTFQDAVGAKRAALSNELEEDDDEDNEIKVLKRQVEGEEEASDEKVSYLFICIDYAYHIVIFNQCTRI